MELHLDQHLFWCISLLVLLNANTAFNDFVQNAFADYIYHLSSFCNKEEETSVEEVATENTLHHSVQVVPL